MPVEPVLPLLASERAASAAGVPQPAFHTFPVEILAFADGAAEVVLPYVVPAVGKHISDRNIEALAWQHGAIRLHSHVQGAGGALLDAKAQVDGV